MKTDSPFMSLAKVSAIGVFGISPPMAPPDGVAGIAGFKAGSPPPPQIRATG